MTQSPPDTPDADMLVASAVDLLTEALALLDAAMAHQPAALTDLAINMLGGWTPDQAEAATASALVH